MRSSAFCLLICLLMACGNDGKVKTIIIKNDLEIKRDEVVALKLKDLTSDTSSYRKLSIADGDSILMTQLFDSDGDSVSDELLVFVSIGPGEEKKFSISDQPHRENRSLVFSRFVPERIDDYAWENDLVAFRMYGPEAQRLTEERQPGGTLSSGIDCWLKRVDYPVVDKWYAKYVAGGTYHKDDGEGYDPYHVGSSRGCGGIGLWLDDSMHVSKNFISWRKLANGPLRSVFELTYAPWKANGITVHETKRISIDAGSQLTMIEEVIETSDNLPHLTIGVTLHEATGETIADSTLGVFGYWEKIDDAYLATGIVVPIERVKNYVDYRSPEKDKSHLLVNVSPQGVVKYYAGFGWSKAGKIRSIDEWSTYLSNFQKRIQSPLKTRVE